jgi:inorganic pyrophosphatase
MTRGMALAAIIVLGCRENGYAQDDPAARVSPNRMHDGQVVTSAQPNLLRDIVPLCANDNVRVVVEIPAGTSAKWEVDKRDGQLKWEQVDGTPRVVHFLPYPGNYGMIPRTAMPRVRGGDGDPLDVIVLGAAVPRGTILEVRLIGVLKLLDDGEQDDKLLAVAPATPLGQVPDIETLKRDFPGVLEIVETWFTSYKGPGRLKSKGFGGAREARRILQAAMAAYEDSPVAIEP